MPSREARTELAQAGPLAERVELRKRDVAGRTASMLRKLGLSGVDQRPTVPGGPILVVGQRPRRSRSPESDH